MSPGTVRLKLYKGLARNGWALSPITASIPRLM